MTAECVPPKQDQPALHWPTIEADYRAGIKSLRQIAGEHGITEGAIRKRAKKEDWERDLAAKIQAKADALVRAEAVRAEVREAGRPPEKEVVEANASVVYTVRMEHRADIRRSRELFRKLLGELEDIGTHGDLAEKLFELVHEPPEGEKRDSAAERERVRKLRQTLEAVLSVPGRVDAVKKAVEMLERLVRMEREAFGIVAGERAGDTAARVIVVPAKEAET